MKQVLVVVLALCTVACKGVGNGNKIEQLRFVKSSTDLATLPTLDVYQCFTDSPVLIADFTDGGVGLFTSRVTYTSSNPAVVQVSNFDISVPGTTAAQGLFYNPGTLFPVAPGTATITAEFAGLATTLPVTVSAPSAISVRNEQYLDTDWLTSRDEIQMVPGSQQSLSAVATLGVNRVPVTTEGSWSSVDESAGTPTNSAVALVTTESGVVIAKSAGDGLQRARIEFAPCSGKSYTAAGVSFNAPAAPADPAFFDYTADYEVLEPTGSLLLLTEKDTISGRDYPKNGEAMISGTRQFLRVMAEFGSPVSSRQDLTFKSGLSVAIGVSAAGKTDDTLSYGVSTALLLAVSAVDAPAVSVTASFDRDSADTTNTPYSSSALMLGVKVGTLDGATVPATPADTPLLSPATARIQHYDANLDNPAVYRQRYAAVGRFTVSCNTPSGVAPCPEEWPINHDVNWSISTGQSDMIVAGISNASSSAGTAVSIIGAPAQDEILIVTAKSNGMVTPTTTGEIPTGTAELKICKTGSSC